MYQAINRALWSAPRWIVIARLNAAAFLAFEYGYESKRTGVYNILWALVFGFATLNILSLLARRFEPNRTRLNFGEMLAILVVVVAVFLLGWEMLYLFHVFPIQLQPHD
jgi:uncharacterized membrane protein YdcZ (DUF606 family)